jgi:hypothetical protein
VLLQEPFSSSSISFEKRRKREKVQLVAAALCSSFWFLMSIKNKNFFRLQAAVKREEVF